MQHGPASTPARGASRRLLLSVGSDAEGSLLLGRPLRLSSVRPPVRRSCRHRSLLVRPLALPPPLALRRRLAPGSPGPTASYFGRGETRRGSGCGRRRTYAAPTPAAWVAAPDSTLSCRDGENGAYVRLCRLRRSARRRGFHAPFLPACGGVGVRGRGSLISSDRSFRLRLAPYGCRPAACCCASSITPRPSTARAPCARCRRSNP